MTISKFQFHTSWLDGEQAHVVIAQPVPCSRDVMLGDASRDVVINTLRDLLTAEYKLQEIVSQGRPAILVLPEVALAFSDWALVDEMVRHYPTPLMLISGFSMTSGLSLRSWLIEESKTVRRSSWTATTEPSSERVYNGGWCWIHTNEHTECVAFLKLTSEQREEVFTDSLDRGTEMVCFECSDVLIFPVICSDFLESENTRTIAAKISAALSDYTADNRKVLVVGLLAQKKSHAEWRRAITDVTRQVHLNKVNICLVNWAFDILAEPEDSDRWRSYSGVYMAGERQASALSFKSVRRFSTDSIHAAVARVTEGCVFGGPVRWDFSGTVRHIWTVSKGYKVEADGTLASPFCDDPLRYELRRFVRRLVEPEEIDGDLVTPPIVDALREVAAHIDSAASPHPDRLVHLTLHGGVGDRSNNLKVADELHKFCRELDLGLKAIGAVALSGEATWQSDDTARAQFKISDAPSALLVWSTSEAAITVKQAIDQMKIDPLNKTPMIIFSKAMGVAPPVSPASKRRLDISAAPQDIRSISDPTSQNVILRVDLDEVAMCLFKPTSAEAKAAVSTLIASKVAELNAQWRDL